VVTTPIYSIITLALQPVAPFSAAATSDLRNPGLQVGARRERAPAVYLIGLERHRRKEERDAAQLMPRGKAGTPRVQERGTCLQGNSFQKGIPAHWDDEKGEIKDTR